MTVTVDIPRCSGYYDKYHWDALSLEAEANVNGDDIDKSVVTVKSLTASADGVKLSLNGTATALMTDPLSMPTLRHRPTSTELPRP